MTVFSRLGFYCGVGITILAAYFAVAQSHAGLETSDRPTQTLRIGTFNFTRDIEGMSTVEQLLRDALLEHGYQMKVEYYPGKRLMAQLNSGLIDGDLYRAADLSRGFENVIRVNEPLIQSCGLIYGLRERGDVKINDASKNIRVGIYGGVPDALAKVLGQFPNVEFVFFKKLYQGVGLLELHRIEFITVANGQEEEFMSLLGKPVSLAGGIVLEPAYFHLHKRHTALAKELAETMHRLKSVHSIVHCTQDTLDLRLASEKIRVPAANP